MCKYTTTHPPIGPIELFFWTRYEAAKVFELPFHLNFKSARENNERGSVLRVQRRDPSPFEGIRQKKRYP